MLNKMTMSSAITQKDFQVTINVSNNSETAVIIYVDGNMEYLMRETRVYRLSQLTSGNSFVIYKYDAGGIDVNSISGATYTIDESGDMVVTATLKEDIYISVRTIY